MKDQNEAYHAVLSPASSSGRVGMYQPFMTSRRKPFLNGRHSRPCGRTTYGQRSPVGVTLTGISEDVVGLGRCGKTLTVLYDIDLPEPEDEEDEERLIDSWTPRFKRQARRRVPRARR